MAAQIGSMFVSLTADMGPFAAQMARAEAITARTARGIRRESGLAAASVDRFSGALGRNINPYGLIAVSRSFERVNERASLLRGSMLALTGVFGGFSAALGANLVLRYADSFTNLSNQIRVVSSDSTDLAGRIAGVAGAADRARASLGATATLYARLQKAAPSRTSSEILEFTETIQKALTLGGATAQEATSAAIQFSQAIASNRLGGEELRAILETPLGLELAKGLGITIGRFREMGHAGELTADVILGALSRIKGNIDEQFSRSVRTIDQSLTLVDNALVKYIGSLDETYGLTRLVSGSFVGFANNLEEIGSIAGVVATALGAAFGGRLIGGGFGKLVDSTFGAVRRGATEAANDVAALRGEQVKLQSQLERSTRAFAHLGKAADIDFASKSDLKRIAREEERLNQIREQRLVNDRRLTESARAIRDVQVGGSRAIEAAGARIVATEDRIIASKERSVALTNSMVQAETRLTAAKGQQVLNTANIGAVRDAEKEIVSIRKAQQAEAERTANLERTLGEQRIGLANRVGQAEARAAEQRARAASVYRTAAAENTRLLQEEFAQNQRLLKVRATVSEIGAINKQGELRVQGQALQALKSGLDSTSASLLAATRNTSILRQSIGLLGRGVTSLVGFLGGPWGVAFTGAIALVTLFSVRAAKAAAQAEQTRNALREVLGEIAKGGGDVGRAAESSAALDELQGKLDDTQAKLALFRKKIEQESTLLRGALNEAFRPFVELQVTQGLGFADVTEGAAAGVADLVDKLAQGTVGFTEIGDAIRGIPEFEFAQEAIIEDIARIVAEIAKAEIALRKTTQAAGQFSQQIAAGAGAANEIQKVRLGYEQFAESVAKSEAALRGSDRALADMISQTRLLARETQFEASIRKATAEIQKDNTDLTATAARELAIVNVVLDTIRGSSDEWLQSSEAVNGEFGALLKTAQQVAGVTDIFVKTLNSTQLLGASDIIKSQVEAAQTAFDRTLIGERQNAILSKEAAILDAIVSKYGTINGLNLDGVRRAAEDITDLERAVTGLEKAREILTGVADGGEGASGSLGGLGLVYTALGASAAEFARKQVESLNAFVQQREATADVTSALQTYREALANIAVPDDVFGALLGTERVREQVGFLRQTMLELAEQFIDGKITGDQLTRALVDIENRMLALGANPDPLRNFINSLITAIGNVKTLSASLDILAQKQSRVGQTGVKTTYNVGGANIDVIRHSEEQGFRNGGFTGTGAKDAVAGFVHGQEYVFDAESTRKIGVGNLESIRRGVRGYRNGGAVGGIGSLMSGGTALSKIEDNTYRANKTLERMIGFLESIESLDESILAAVKQIRVSSGSGSGGSGLGSGGGGYAGSGGFGRRAGFGSANSAYHYNPRLAPPGGAQYDPIQDFLLNGNYGALGAIARMPYAWNEATPFNNPFHVDRNRFTSNSDIAELLRRQGPSGGSRNVFGFNSGGMIYPGDSQAVSFFKNPREAVGIFTPQQMKAMSDAYGSGGTSVGDINIYPQGGVGDRQSQLRLRDELVSAIKEAQGMP